LRIDDRGAGDATGGRARASGAAGRRPGSGADGPGWTPGVVDTAHGSDFTRVEAVTAPGGAASGTASLGSPPHCAFAGGV